MSTTTTLRRRRNPVALAAGILNFAIAATVLAGYASGNASLATLLPGAAPMQFLTACGILASAAAILLLAAGWFRTAAAAASVCGIAGVVSLAAAMGLPIAALGLPGRSGSAAPQGGLLVGVLLILGAVALVLMSGVVRLRSRLALVGILGSAVHSIGAVAAICYFGGVASAFSEGQFSRLALPTAIALAVLGIALIRFAWRDSLATDTGTPAWLPLLVISGTLAACFALYGAVLGYERSSFAHQFAIESEELAQFLGTELDNRIQPLVRLARRRAVAPAAKKDEWDADTQALLLRGGYQAVEWIDSAGRVIWTTPPGAGDQLADTTAAFESRRQEAFERARQNRALAATRPVDLVTGGKGAIVLVPVFVHEQLTGYVAGVFRYKLLFENLLASNPFQQYAISISDRDEPIFERGVANRENGLIARAALPLGEFSWTLAIRPTEALVLTARSPAPGALLVGGGLVALLFGLLVRLAQVARLRPREAPLPHAISRAPFGAPSPDSERLAVVSFARDGSPLAWNEGARQLFAGPPPRIAPAEEPFRILPVTLLRCSGSEGTAELLRPLLDSCALPALVFDAEGHCLAANSVAGALGWPEAEWRGRQIGWPSGRPVGSFEVQNIVILQGTWAVSAGLASTAAHA